MPASNLQAMRSMAHNNAWANHRLLRACAQLTQPEFEATRNSFFPSIQTTLNHILIVDWFYVDALECGTLGPTAWLADFAASKMLVQWRRLTVDVMLSPWDERRRSGGASRW